jgi:MFS family permease
MDQAKNIRQEAVFNESQNGLLDVIVGIIVLGFGIGILTGLFWLGGILLPVLLPAWLDAKKRLANRDRGYQPIPAQMQPMSIALVGLMIVGLLALILGIVLFLIFSQGGMFPGLFSWLQEYFPLVLGAVAALLFAIFGAITHTGRFFLYAILAMAIFTVSYFLDLSLGIAVTSLGGLIFLAGSYILSRFLKEHPAAA